MGKKKSKTQKYRKSIKRKANKTKEINLREIKQEKESIEKIEQKKNKKETPSFLCISKEKKKEKKKQANLLTLSNLSNFFKIPMQNRHILFNVFLLLTYCFFLLGLITIKEYSGRLILFIASILFFLIIIAISYNKYTSGKIFTMILIGIMGVSIYKLQYNYDFIRSLNTQKYEKKTYYIVTFDTNNNRSVYVLNNKKIGLLNENSTNIERKLNTKLDNVTYLTYENINDLTDSFYKQEFRGIIVNENQYKYLINSNYNRSVKILYEFDVNGLKET